MQWSASVQKYIYLEFLCKSNAIFFIIFSKLQCNTPLWNQRKQLVNCEYTQTAMQIHVLSNCRNVYWIALGRVEGGFHELPWEATPLVSNGPVGLHVLIGLDMAVNNTPQIASDKNNTIRAMSLTPKETLPDMLLIWTYIYPFANQLNMQFHNRNSVLNNKMIKDTLYTWIYLIVFSQRNTTAHAVY